MTTAILSLRRPIARPLATPVPVIATGLAFVALFWQPLATLARDWLTDPEAGHGLLLFPVALYLAWRRGLEPARPERGLGLILLGAAVLLRYVSELAAELFTMRLSLFVALAALVIFLRGRRQLHAWWLPATLLVLSIPLPAVVLGSLALPLQFTASRLGAWLLAERHVPVLLAGNIIHLPNRALFVTEACSGLRSLAALLALAVLMGGLWLRSPWLRVVLLAIAIPTAVVLNGVRIFLTGFLAFFVDPRFGEGVLHYSEGWTLFVVAFCVLGALTWMLGTVDHP